MIVELRLLCGTPPPPPPHPPGLEMCRSEINPSQRISALLSPPHPTTRALTKTCIVIAIKHTLTCIIELLEAWCVGVVVDGKRQPHATSQGSGQRVVWGGPWHRGILQQDPGVVHRAGIGQEVLRVVASGGQEVRVVASGGEEVRVVASGGEELRVVASRVQVLLGEVADVEELGQALEETVLALHTHLGFHRRTLKQRERETVYLTTHSTYLIYGYLERERNVLFNDALNTFYLRLYGERNVLFNDALNTFYLRLYGEKRFI